MKLSRTVLYAVQAVLLLAQQEPTIPVPCSRLAAAGDMPERFLLQILRNLVTHGILRSTRGVDGGYALLRPADEITLLDIFEAIEGPLGSYSLDDHSIPAESRQKLQAAFGEINTAMRKHLSAVKVSQLLPEGKK